MPLWFVATILHGYVRATTDIELIRVVLTETCYKPRVPVAAHEFADTKKRNGWTIYG